MPPSIAVLAPDPASAGPSPAATKMPAYHVLVARRQDPLEELAADLASIGAAGLHRGLPTPRCHGPVLQMTAARPGIPVRTTCPFIAST